jgi:hypothetical protein
MESNLSSVAERDLDGGIPKWIMSLVTAPRNEQIRSLMFQKSVVFVAIVFPCVFQLNAVLSGKRVARLPSVNNR